MRLNPVTGLPQQKAAEFPQNNQTVIVPGGFNPNRYYNKSQIDALFATVEAGDVDSVNGQTGVVVLDTDDIAEGSTNLYSQWQRELYGSNTYIHPETSTDGLVIGADLHSSLTTTFAGASAFYNGDAAGGNGGVNYYLVLAYGVSFIAIGGLYAGGHARGTPAAPEQTLSGDYLTAYIGAGYDGAGDWIVNGATHILSGIYQMAAGNASGGVLEKDIWIGSLTGRMIGWESDTNNININEAMLDANITAFYDLGTALAIDGGTGNITAGALSGSTANSLANIDTAQTFTNKDVKSATNTFAAVTTTASSATPTPTGSSRENELYVTAQAAAAAFAAPTGSPVNGNKLLIRIKDNGTARALTYDAIYRAVGVPLPSTTVLSKTLYLGFKYNSADSKWDLIASAQES